MSRLRRLAVILVSMVVTVGVLPGVASATAPAFAQRRLTVQTYNLYLGADLTPLFGKSGLDLVLAAGAVYAQVVQTDFPSRAGAIARQLDATDPDVVGLQEVAIWQTAPVADPTDVTTTYDFLDLLLGALSARGLHYHAVVANSNFAGALPISLTTLAMFADRDVILVRDGLAVGDTASGTYTAHLTVPLGESAIPVPRGWSTADVTYRGKTVRFANTHFEAFSPTARDAQAAELLTVLGDSPYPIVLTGDFNADPGTGAHAILVAGGFVDSWTEAMGSEPGLTDGQAADLLNVPSQIDSRIDYVMHDTPGYLAAVSGSGVVVGEELGDRTAGGLWPSDHAGVAVTIHVAHP